MDYLQYKIISDPLFPTMKRVVPVGKGSVHMSLRGLFTGVREATKAIDNFENTRKESDDNGPRVRYRRSKQV